MVGFGSNWYQMHRWVLAWRWHMVGFGSNCYHIHTWEINEDLRQFSEDLKREANGECKVDRTVQTLEPLRSLLVCL